MRNIYTLLILLTIISAPASAARAENGAPAALTAAEDAKSTIPANMSDEALASFISGRLKPLLQDSGYEVIQNCSQNGCSVVVQ